MEGTNKVNARIILLLKLKNDFL